jgi:hypothetical protein
VACGLAIGAIQPNGRIAQPIRLTGDLQLTQQDIRQVQLAKGAIAGGLRVLLRRMGANADDVSALYLAGAFGNYINVAGARRIGLLEFPDDIIRPADDDYGELRAGIEHVPLGADPDFQEEYVGAMGF